MQEMCIRDSCGPVWKKEKGAFLAGVPGAEMSVKFGIVGAIEHPQDVYKRQISFVLSD